jgi:peptidoglycan hydrolase-like protein with peptidoglycan-binding domain
MRALCSDRTFASTEQEYIAARWAYFFSIPEGARTNFERIEATWPARIEQQCGLQLQYWQTYLSRDKISCVTNAYSSLANQLKSRLSGDALEEARLTTEERIALQGALNERGFLTSASDGQFASSTRVAIRRFQELQGAQQTGFLSAVQRSALFNQDYPPRRSSQSLPPTGPPSSQSPIPKTCPKTSAGYPERFDLIKARIDSLKRSVETWKALRAAAQKAEKVKAGSICVSYLDRIKQAVAEIPASRKTDETLLLDSFGPCIDHQLLVLEKEIKQAHDDPVAMLLHLHGELIRIKIRYGHLTREYSAQRGIMDATKTWFSASVKQCRI